jgi:hypothetical protein
MERTLKGGETMAPKKEKIVEETLTEQAIPEIVVEDPSERLEWAAQLLCSALPDYIVTALDRAADAAHLKIWQQILGLLVFCFKSGTIVSPDIDPQWLSGTPLLVQESKCGICDKSFKPKNRGQLYCSNECGLVAARKVFLDQRAKLGLA